MTVPHGTTGGGFLTRGRLALLVFLAIAAFFLATEHTAHLFGLLPFGLLLLCPLMHFFMHGSHGGGDQHSGHGGAAGQPGPTDRLGGGPS